jgi:hypothetical protein
MGVSFSSKKVKRKRERPTLHVSDNQTREVVAPLPSEHGVLMNIKILFNFIRDHSGKLYPQAVQETVQLFGRNNPPIDGMKVADIILNIPPKLRRKKTWKEAAGRKTGGDGYAFGDFTASLLTKQRTGNSKQKRQRESVRNLFFQYRSICNQMSQQELVDMAHKFFPSYSIKDCIEGMRMFQEGDQLQQKLYEDLNNLLRLMEKLTRETLYHTFALLSERNRLGLSFHQIETLVEQITKAEELSSRSLLEVELSPEVVVLHRSGNAVKASTNEVSEVKSPLIEKNVLSLKANANDEQVPDPRSKRGETQNTEKFFSESNTSFLDLLSARIRKRDTWRYLHNSNSKFKTVFPIFRGQSGCVMGILKSGYNRSGEIFL